MIRDAVRAGVGAGRLPILLVSHNVLWAQYPSRRLLNARVSAFLDYLKGVLPRGTPDELAACIGP
jgi:DNA-binding transcriptional LysR family regulator